MTGRDHPSRQGPPTAPTASHAPTIYELRILDTVADLVESFRLRYEVYDAVGYLQRQNRSKLEIDEHDVCAIPFGAFDLTTGEMIGTLRLISNETQPGYQALILRVVEDFADDQLRERTSGPAPGRLPSVLSDEVDRQVDAFNTAGYPIRELSRGIIHPAHRGSGIGRGMMELGLAHATRDAPVVLVGGCLPEHLPMYARYGYQKLPESRLDRFDHVGQIANVMICRTDALPEPTQTHIDDLLRSMKSGAPEHIRELAHGSQALYPITAPHRARRRTMEW
jgi:predicted GNAT family N-acyltransferase